MSIVEVGKKYKKAQRDLELIRAELHVLIVDSAMGGMGAAEISRLTGYTRDGIRQILRKGGVEPRPPGRPRKRAAS